MLVANLQEVVQRGPQKVHDHNVVVSLPPRPHYPRNSGSAHERLVYSWLLLQHGILGVGWLDFNSHFFSSYGMCTHENRAYVWETGNEVGVHMTEPTNAPHPPYPISSSSLYFPPYVKSIVSHASLLPYLSGDLINDGTASLYVDGKWNKGERGRRRVSDKRRYPKMQEIPVVLNQQADQTTSK